jgi:hypothetical protein
MLIGVTFSGDMNVIKKEAEKNLKYKDQTYVMPVMTGTTRTMLTFKLSPWFIFLQFSSFWVITRRLV